MAVDEARRVRLFERLKNALGQEEAVTMLELLPPSGQRALTREELRGELEDLRAELAHYATKEDLRAELAHYATKADLYRIFTAQTVALAAVLGAAAAFFG